MTEDTKFKPGNKFWEKRSSHGRKPIFESPDELEEGAIDYFNWCHDNPLYEDKVCSFQGMNEHVPLAKLRAFTIEGLLIRLEISRGTWDNYCEKPDFLEVTDWIKMVIYTQKFEGAAAGQLNPNIIARDLGLADKQDITATGDLVPFSEIKSGVDGD
ncbi:DNA-packaging protein [Sessilibacter corallicola]|uniref:DNA-packaging protein n=1 Tax=Sessilibacter corallicola TaxID=2904075 RepID=UPI001E3C800A|nr:DNA-packaging protein [Sessilibacter corallicola]MCE2029279.1 DNA-packaging protein [Sessilibacter corallicola]